MAHHVVVVVAVVVVVVVGYSRTPPIRQLQLEVKLPVPEDMQVDG